MSFLDDYEPVEKRIAAFYKDNPDGCIHTELVSHENGGWIFKATIFREGAVFVGATGYAHEVETQRGVNSTSACENCETSAIGRALANLGYAAKRRPSREEMAKTRRPPAGRAPADGASGGGPVSRPTDPPPEHVSGIALHNEQAKVKALQAHGVSVADERKKRHLPLLDDKVTEDEFGRWKQMLAELDRQVAELPIAESERAS